MNDLRSERRAKPSASQQLMLRGGAALSFMAVGFAAGASWNAGSDPVTPQEVRRESAEHRSSGPSREVARVPARLTEDPLDREVSELADPATLPATIEVTDSEASESVPGLSIGGFEFPGYTAPRGVDRRTEDLYRRYITVLPYEIRKAQQMADPTEVLKNIAFMEAQMALMREARYEFLGESDGSTLPQMLRNPRTDPHDSDEFFAETNVGGLRVAFRFTRAEFPAVFNPK